MNQKYFLLLLLALCTSTAHTSNWQWLRNTGLESLTDTDWKIFNQTLDNALNTASDGEIRHWKNPDSGNHGSVELLSSALSMDKECRKVRLVTETTKKEEGRPLTFCKNQEGKWLIDTLSPDAK
ncbi:MAG TPA: hypothetical protein ENG92_00525 [Thiolapillus brandeum]|uniref:Surface antigen domain-containing protein n=1 Tax=Thiolapillus brandeum TaxID=1076588 RepID=A0A831K7S8_9GAMM|nr:hypothetical protein [Thiolapillus brandeum]